MTFKMNNTNEVSRKRKIAQSSSDIGEDFLRQKKRQRKEASPSSDVSGSLNARREEIQMDVDNIEHSSLASYLPPEILFKIFNERIFKYSDLHQLSAVCSSWNECLKDEAFAWRMFIKDRLSDNLPGGSGDRFTVGLENVLNKFRSSARHDVYDQKWMIKILKGDKEIGMSELCDYSAKHFKDVLESDIYAVDLLPSLNHWNTAWCHYLQVRINFARLERLIRNEKAVPIDLLTAVLMRKLKVGPFLSKLYDAKKSYNPEASSQFVVEQPKAITGLKMHKYQINAINWMVFREKEADQAFELSPLIPIGRTNMYLHGTSTSHEILYLDTAQQIHKYNLSFKSKGGIIADEMGLGKTVEVIGLIASNPRTDFTPIDTSKSAPRYQTKATLIVCPNHLVAQWKSEIEKYCGKEMTALMITTIVQVKKFNSQDILDADVVLITYNLLSNDNYFAFKKENNKKTSSLTAKGVILEQFHWHRVVVDEGHEQSVMPSFKSTYRWYMTGTPFTKDGCLTKVRSFLGLSMPKVDKHRMREFDPKGRYFSGNCKYERYIDDMLDDILINNCLWRNTKASIKDEYELVKTKSKYMILEFNPLEKVIYQDKSDNYSYSDSAISFCNTFATTGEEASLTQLFETRKYNKKTDVANLKVRAEKEYYYSTFQMQLKERQERLLKLYEAVQVKPVKAEENSLEWLIERFGTKTAHMYLFLKDLFAQDDEARALIFSQDDNYLALLKEMLEQRGIYTSTIKGYDNTLISNRSDLMCSNVHKKSKELKNFKNADSMVRVVLLNTTKVASGMNLIEASHVIFMDVCGGSDGAAHEAQAIGRAYRQGQTKHVTVVRFVIKNTTEFEAFAKRCPGWDKELPLGLNQSQSSNNNTPSKAKLMRSGSFGVLLANSQ